MKRLPFFRTCVGWKTSDVDALRDMIDDATRITRRTFLRHVDQDDMLNVEQALGYARRGLDLTMKRDWHVAYFRGTLHGRVVYFFTWSGIEHVFAEEGGDE